jgi:hypothetical protein
LLNHFTSPKVHERNAAFCDELWSPKFKKPPPGLATFPFFALKQVACVHRSQPESINNADKK